MYSTSLKDFARSELKANLALCTESGQNLFKKMYGMSMVKTVEEALKLSVDEVVDNMPDDRLDWALRQVEATLEKKEEHK